MSKPREVEITIPPDGGEAIVDLDGYQGKGCSDVAAELVKALGGKVVKSDKKCEYYQKETKQQQKVNRGI